MITSVLLCEREEFCFYKCPSNSIIENCVGCILRFTIKQTFQCLLEYIFCCFWHTSVFIIKQSKADEKNFIMAQFSVKTPYEYFPRINSPGNEYTFTRTKMYVYIYIFHLFLSIKGIHCKYFNACFNFFNCFHSWEFLPESSAQKKKINCK